MFRLFSKRLTSARRRSRRLAAERLESRALMAANPIGITPTDTGEFMLGRVVITPILFESTGALDPSTQDWSPSEIDQFLAKVVEGADWWTETLATLTDKHQLEFVVDPTFATTPMATKYEPIDRPSEGFVLFGRDFLTSQGIANTTPFQQAVYQFNDSQREKFDADWGFTIFVADSSDKLDGGFASGGAFTGAFAFAGGQFIVMPSTRPASTITHEMGHIFWAHDEYAGGETWSARRGYYNTQNTNAADNPTDGFVQEDSIMRGGAPLQASYASHTSPASTLAMIGWKDSDGDGVFDLADVPLEFDAVGHYELLSSTYRLTGSAAAVPLINRNSSGNQSDITFNRVSRVEYSVDDGPWQVAATPDAQRVDSIDIAISLPNFNEIRWRVIDASTGITSAILSGTPTSPLLAAASVLGFAYLDQNDDFVPDVNESAYQGLKLRLTGADGSSLLAGSIDAATVGENAISNSAELTVFAKNPITSLPVFAGESDLLDGKTVFRSFNNDLNQFTEGWTLNQTFAATFGTSIGEVELTVWGLDDASYGRIEAYDASGLLIARTTTDSLTLGESTKLRVVDPSGRIAAIRAYGHAKTQVAISDFHYGNTTSLETDFSGTFRIPNLPVGSYRIELETSNVTLQAEASSFVIDVAGTVATPTSFAIQRVDSPFFNPLVAEDVNVDGNVTAADALAVINDLNLNQSRIISHNEVPAALVDVNNDGQVTAMDALMVVNWLNQADLGGLGEGESGGEETTSPRKISTQLLSPLAAEASSDVIRHRDHAFADWGDPADYVLEAESNRASEPDTQEDWVSSVDARQGVDPTKKRSVSFTPLMSCTLKLADLSLHDVLLANTKNAELSSEIPV